MLKRVRGFFSNSSGQLEGKHEGRRSRGKREHVVTVAQAPAFCAEIKSTRYVCENCGKATAVDHLPEWDGSDAEDQGSTFLSDASTTSSACSSDLQSSPFGSPFPPSPSAIADGCVPLYGSAADRALRRWNTWDGPPESQHVEFQAGQFVQSPSSVDEAIAQHMSVCACGEWGCTARCDVNQGPSPRQLRFFNLDEGDIPAGEPDSPASAREREHLFCGPECQWSFRAREEYDIGQKVARKKILERGAQLAKLRAVHNGSGGSTRPAIAAIVNPSSGDGGGFT